jgi:hypothetical protein
MHALRERLTQLALNLWWTWHPEVIEICHQPQFNSSLFPCNPPESRHETTKISLFPGVGAGIHIADEQVASRAVVVHLRSGCRRRRGKGRAQWPSNDCRYGC